jgi:cysteine-rich repeat protein
MPWLFAARLVRVFDERAQQEPTTEGRLQSFFGMAFLPEPLEAAWSAPLGRGTVYLAHPDGDRLLDLAPFVVVAHVEGANQDRLHLWKNIPELTDVVLVDDDAGHVCRLRPRRAGVEMPFRAWTKRQPDQPSPVVRETTARALLRAPPPPDLAVEASRDDGRDHARPAPGDSMTTETTTETTAKITATPPRAPGQDDQAARRRGRVGRASMVLLTLCLAAGAVTIVVAIARAIAPAIDPRCGDGVVDVGEECDDGNAIAGDACDGACRSSLASIAASPVWLGFRDDEVDAGLPLVMPSRRSPEYLRSRADFARPATPVFLSGFRLMKTEASRAAFAAFLRDDGDGRLAAADRRGVEALQWHRALFATVRARHRDEGALLQPAEPLLPIEAPLDEAVAFCAWLGGALPTEPQWELAAKGSGRGRTFPWGDRVPQRSPEDCDLLTAQFMTSLDPPASFNCGDRRPSLIGSKPAGCTPEGICDQSGNVDEWVLPGPVRWVREPDPNDNGAFRFVARLPGPRPGDLGTYEVATPCDTAWDDPAGLRTGVVRDCYHPGTAAESTATHPQAETLGVVRGGNFDDSLPVFYQARARYPYFPTTRAKGFRCAFPPVPVH